jgi:ATP-grasp domain
VGRSGFLAWDRDPEAESEQEAGRAGARDPVIDVDIWDHDVVATHAAPYRIIESHLRPAVVFVDDGPWENFFHLAGALRRSGLRTVRISVGPARWQPAHLLFDRNVSLPAAPSAEQLVEILSSEYVADVQVAEGLAPVTYAALSMLPPDQRSDLWVGRSDMLDKFEVGRLLRDLRLRVPDTLAADMVSPSQAVAQLSLPIVLKKRLGSSGVDVRIFDSLDELEQSLNGIDHLSEWFFERFVPGRSIVCAGYVSDDGIEIMATYEVVTRAYARGPSRRVIFLDDASLIETGVRLMESVKVRGFVCFDIIRDGDHQDWIHDVNPRAFGGLSMCQIAGFDFLGAYLRCLTGQGPVEPMHVGATGAEEFSFPGGRREVFRTGRRRSAALRTLQWAWRHERLFGARYFVFLVLRRMTSAWRRPCPQS